MMKINHMFALLGLGAILLSIPNSHACSCFPGPSAQGTLSDSADVFMGRVVKDLNPTPPPGTGGDGSVFEVNQDPKQYLVRVRRIFKSCTLEVNNYVVVTTGANSAMCGIELTLNQRYVFSGTVEAADAATIAVSGMQSLAGAIWVGICGYNIPWDSVAPADKRVLVNYGTVPCKPPCKTGAECASSTEYCDAGKCIAFDAPCPPYTPVVTCLAAPCTVSRPCAQASSGLKCLNNYCGGCNAIFIDGNRSRICSA
jgi:hypothetical protein